MDEVSLNSEPVGDDDADGFEIEGDCAMTEYVGQAGIIQGENPLPPAVGMEFESYEDVYYFYNCYAKDQGFGVRVSNTWYRKSKERYRGKLSCSSAGFKKKSEANRPRPETRTGCPAMIKFRLMDSKRWRIIEVEVEHNHLISPKSGKFYKSHKHLGVGTKRALQLESAEEAQKIRLFRTVVIDADDNESLDVDEGVFGNNVDFCNQLKLKVGDAQAVLNYFTHMQLINPNFFYVVDLNEKGCLRNLFWTDARARVAYGYFGDVVAIDTTCLTNKYEVPLVSFVGMNHHGQSVLLGCGLLVGETIESYTWLFRAWLTCMLGRPPQAIITDQCSTLQTAVADVFPRASHCLCLSHIMQKIPEKLEGLYEYEAIIAALNRAVYHSLRSEEFEAAWEDMMQRHGLRDQKWLQVLYEDRKRWVPVYLLQQNLQSNSMEFTRVYTSSFSFLSTVTRCRHDVFLSFRGEDTRHNITQQLHRALVEANIPTFKDDINLQKGGEIASELLKAIQMSRIAIVVFSKNYATSGWCLDELVQILECKNQAGMLVLPIFYDVDPLHVEHQTGTFGEAFTAQEERFRNGNLTENKLEKWRAALTEAASLSKGWDLPNVASWHQSKFIKEIVKHIMDRHQDAHMNVSIFPPGMDSGKEYLNLLLSVISDDVLIIGICGMGKTTIAKAVYDQNFQRFEGSSFLSDVSRIAETPDGLLALQKQLLSDILIKDSLNIDNVERGIEVIKNEFCCKRIFVVLDNVNSLDQLNALARKRDWYGSGSRIIITTEDAQLLNVLEVDDVYGAQGIQVIKDKYRQNLQMIEDYKDFILKSHAQAHEKDRLLIAEIKSERMKRTSEAQNIDDIEESLGQMFPLSTLTSTMNAIMIGMGNQSCGLGALQGNMLDFELEEEIISRNALVGNGGETRMPLCYAYGGFGERINRDDTAEKDSVQGTMHLSILGMSEYGDKQEEELLD